VLGRDREKIGGGRSAGRNRKERIGGRNGEKK
jgi:hypothetical protein